MRGSDHALRAPVCLLIIGHGRRKLLWFAVARHPTAEWLAQQIVEAFPWDTAPTYLVRDNDGAYGAVFTRRVRAMGIRDRPTSPRSPWQNPYAERLIGTLRRDCLDHVVIFGARHLRWVMAAVFRLLQQDAYAPVVRKRCAARPSDPAAWSHYHCVDFVRTASLLRADIIFGRDSGLDLLPKAKAARPDVPVIMITAYGDTDTRRKALANGADAFLTKPVDLTIVRNNIDMRVGHAA